MTNLLTASRYTKACALTLCLCACHATAQAPGGAGYRHADAAYKAYALGDHVIAVDNARQAVRLEPANREYRFLLINTLTSATLDDEAELAATDALAAHGGDGGLLVQRGRIRQRLGKDALASADFEAALRSGNIPLTAEIGLLADLDRRMEARLLFDKASAGTAFATLPDVDVAYLAARVGDDANASRLFNRADKAGKLPNTAYEDAGFTALRMHDDPAALAYFKRSIDGANTGQLRMDPEHLFNARRAVAEVSRQGGIIASLTFRGPASSLGPTGATGADTLQVGAEGYWRPFGYRNGRYVELFARAFQTLRSEDGPTGSDTLQSAIGLRYKPFQKINLVGSLSRVFALPSGNDDWLAQLGYSGHSGADPRVAVAAWWTSRLSAEAGRYLDNRTHYALANAEIGRSFRLGSGNWVIFPHISLAADFDSTAARRHSSGIGPGFSARYWFNEDIYSAVHSFLDLTIQYRYRISGADRARGTFATATLSY